MRGSSEATSSYFPRKQSVHAGRRESREEKGGTEGKAGCSSVLFAPSQTDTVIRLRVRAVSEHSYLPREAGFVKEWNDFPRE